MADAFQNIKSAWNRGVTTISVKTSSSLEKSKLKTHIDTLNREVEKETFAVGEATYKLWISGSQDYSSLGTYLLSIKNKLDEIEQLNVQLASIDDRDNQILGNNPAPEVKEEALPKYICTNCGTQYDSPFKFCRKCGNKMAE